MGKVRLLIAFLILAASLLVPTQQASAYFSICADYESWSAVPVLYYGAAGHMAEVQGAVNTLSAKTSVMACHRTFYLVDMADMDCTSLNRAVSAQPLSNTGYSAVFICTHWGGFDGVDGCPICALASVNPSPSGNTPLPPGGWTNDQIHRSLIELEYDTTTSLYTSQRWQDILGHELIHAVGGAGDAVARSSTYPSVCWGFSHGYDHWDWWWLERRYGGGPEVEWYPGTFG